MGVYNLDLFLADGRCGFLVYKINNNKRLSFQFFSRDLCSDKCLDI